MGFYLWGGLVLLNREKKATICGGLLFVGWASVRRNAVTDKTYFIFLAK